MTIRSFWTTYQFSKLSRELLFSLTFLTPLASPWLQAHLLYARNEIPKDDGRYIIRF